MKKPLSALAVIALLGSVNALLKLQLIHEFPLGTWLENLAPRTSYPPGVLVNMLSSPDVYLVPTDPPSPPIHIAHIPNHLGLMGIPEMGLLNGLTALNAVEGILLAADSELGVVWSIDVRTGKTGVAINDTSMAPVQSSTVPLGINGLHVVDQSLYFTNTNKVSLSRVPLDMTTGMAIGPVETLVKSSETCPDDFTVDFRGNVWLASDAYNELVLLANATATSTSVSSNIQVISGSPNAKRFMGPSATAFGNSALDLQRGSLYVTINGGMEPYKYKNWTVGGSLLRCDVASFLS
ncbi:hypothetical protein LTR80_011638 [Exophiala xenobiotica]